jgi:hypothetical protein
MNASFVSRFLAFSLAFYVGSVAAIFVLTVVKWAVFFQHHSWSWLLGLMRYDVVPVALAELYRSPIMGLFFALLGARGLAPSSTIKFGMACGAFSYAIAFLFTMIRSTPGPIAQAVIALNLIECSLLGLPVALVLLSHFFAARNI